MQKDFALLEARIGYQFHQKNILREALTLSSYSNELRARSKREVQCNERLEFLGDAVLASIVSEYLFLTYPTLPEGELTQRRKAVVQSSALAQTKVTTFVKKYTSNLKKRLSLSPMRLNILKGE